MATPLETAIETNAAGPKSVTVDGQNATQHSLKEQIEADQHLAANDALRSKKRGLTIARFRHQDAVQ